MNLYSRTHMLRHLRVFIVVSVLLMVSVYWYVTKSTVTNITSQPVSIPILQPHPLSIEYLRKRSYPQSTIRFEELLEPGPNYDRHIVSYTSDGLKIFGLLTIPHGEKPQDGWPVIILNHGFIQPREYKTTERYVAYVDGFARNGYIVFKPDYRGHGNSQGTAEGGYGSPAYTIDILNAVSAIKAFKDANPNKIGMWGHSMGGYITLRSMVATKDIKAGVIWAGVVASYSDFLRNWRRTPPFPLPTGTRSWRRLLVEQYGEPEENPTFWNSISANSYLLDISGPVQLHHGTSDTSVPVIFSEKLEKEMRDAKKEVTLYAYPGDDHNISVNFSLAMNRSVAFFDKHVKKD